MRKLIIGILFVLPLIALIIFNSSTTENRTDAMPTTTSAEVLETAPIAMKQVETISESSQKEVTSVDKKKSKKVKLHRQAQKVVKNELHPAPNLTPAKAKKVDLENNKKSLQANNVPKKDRNFDNPLSDRWLNQNSEIAKFDMQNTPKEQGCSNAIEDCVQKRKDQQVTLVGVVVTTDKLSKNPLNSVRGDKPRSLR